MVMAFGSGALISALSLELTRDALDRASAGAVIVASALAAVLGFAAAAVLSGV